MECKYVMAYLCERLSTIACSNEAEHTVKKTVASCSKSSDDERHSNIFELFH